MSKVKIIPQKYIDKINSYNFNTLLMSTEYINEDSALKFYCQKHDVEYCQTLKNALRRNGCPECKKEKRRYNSYTTIEFKEMVTLKNPHIEVLGEYTKQGCKILCKCLRHDIEFEAVSQSLMQGKGGCPMCTKEKHSQQRISSEELRQRFDELNPRLKLVDEHIKLNTWVKVYCMDCRQYFDKMLTYPYIKNKQCKCSVCINRTIIEGFNDVATTRPDLIKYFKDKNDALKYGHGMTDKLTFVCPDCGFEKELKIEVLARQGFGCPCCGDGVSYPNKFIRSFMRQLNVDNMIFEYSPNWAKKYFYDCHFEYKGCKYLIEIDGQQHFKKSSNFEMTLAEVQKRDKEKAMLAEYNGYILIRIDAQKSNKDYLLGQIKNSLLANLFDISKIDWDKCNADATTNLAKEICLYAEKTMPNKYCEICQVYNISADTIRKYLRQGTAFGWCSYRVVEKLAVPKKVSVYDNNNNLLYIFNGIQECSKQMSKMYNGKFNIHGISDNCHGIRDSFKGYVFKFTYNTI
jgi:hypothetical protein